MPPRLALIVPLVLSSVVAQTPEPTLAITPQPRTNITRNAGLQPDGPGRLLGGGEHYMVWLSADGMRFVPALGRDCPETRYLTLRPVSARRGAESIVAEPFAASPEQEGLRASFPRATGIEERYDVGVDGVEVSWRFEQRPAGSGDLVVRYAVDTNLPGPAAAGRGLAFVEPAFGGVAIGGVTGVDANGDEVPGGLAFADGTLEMRLPAGFVDRAAYPIVLDPLIGSVITVVAGGNTDSEPDAAYDHSNSNYLVAWLRAFSGSLIVPRAQLVDTMGNLVGPTVFLSSVGPCGRPRVANFPPRDRFGVVFEETDGLFEGIQFRAVSAASGAITHAAVLASSTGVGLFTDPDIGGDANAPLQSTRAFVAIWEDNIQNAIRARRIWFDSSDQLVSPNPVSVLSDSGGIGSSYSEPAMSRQSGLDSRYLIAVRRFSGIGPSLRVSLALIENTTLQTVSSTALPLSQTDEIGRPDVDGYSGAWVVAWQQTAPGSSSSIRRCSVRYDNVGGWTVGAIESIGGATLSAASAPSVGWAPGRTWLGYRNFSGIGPQVSLRAAAIDSASSTWGNDTFSQVITSSHDRMVVATTTSGGVPSGEIGLAAFAHGDTIYAQRVINYGNGGSYVGLGGQCGAGGAQVFSHDPGIGSSALVCNLVGLAPTALVSVFNLAPPGAGSACGPCVWTPFAVTAVEAPVGGVASVAFPIPCLPSLVGAQFESQWTTIDPSQAPCPLLPGFSLSDRVLMTLGN